MGDPEKHLISFVSGSTYLFMSMYFTLCKYGLMKDSTKVVQWSTELEEKSFFLQRVQILSILVIFEHMRP